jgi:hypothetical protein
MQSRTNAVDMKSHTQFRDSTAATIDRLNKQRATISDAGRFSNV